MFQFEPTWYLFFYLTCRPGLRRGEVYAVARSRIREETRKIVIDRAVQPGKGDRPSKVITRKNDEAYTLDVSEDVLEAIRWHIEQGYAGPEFLFSKTGQFTKYLCSDVEPMERVPCSGRSAEAGRVPRVGGQSDDEARRQRGFPRGHAVLPGDEE